MTSLPTGTVTFLYTDIEGSTRRWEETPAAMHAALARHDALLRGAIEAHDGVVFRTAGDAFSAAFRTAPQGVAAALAAQRALAARDREAAAAGGVWPLRVRMALHAGTPLLRGGEYQGPHLNRVARLLAVGYGGQTLLSRSAAELARDALPPGAELRDLGEHRLKDLERPERIYQLVVPDLPDDFPPLKTLDPRRHNLPVQPTPLIGREREVAAVLALLRDPDVRLVTLTGPGGIGKTRLALQIGAELLDEFPDGVTLVLLAAAADPETAVAAIARAVGARQADGQTPLEGLQESLRDKQALLLLDNFEQVLGAAPAVAELLGACPGLKCLVTSRAALRLSAERELAVAPLALPPAPGELPARPAPRPEELRRLGEYEAVRLFVERAQAVRGDFELTAETAPVVAEIVRRLDGLPLAIELAAARVRVLSPPAILQRLGHGLDVLVGGAPDLPARQRTLRRTIDWSHELLSPEEQVLFRRLAVFVGGASLEAAEAICGAEGRGAKGEGRPKTQEWGTFAESGVSQSSPLAPRPPVPSPLDVLGGVESLVSQSLLRRVDGTDGEPRFTMLETIREYALERLAASGEEEATRRAHAEYYLLFGERALPYLATTGREIWMDRLGEEHDNLREALRWAVQQGREEFALRLMAVLGPFWELRGYFGDGRR